MKLFIVTKDDSEYQEGTYIPEAAFTEHKFAKIFADNLEHFWGDCNIHEVDVENVKDTVFCVYAEEAYSSGAYDLIDAYATEEEADCRVDEINDDTEHQYSTYFNAECKEVSIDPNLEYLKDLEERVKKKNHIFPDDSGYPHKFMPGDKVRMLTLEELQKVDGVMMIPSQFCKNQIINEKCAHPRWINMTRSLTDMFGKEFTVSYTIGDCIVVPGAECPLQEWFFEKI